MIVTVLRSRNWVEWIGCGYIGRSNNHTLKFTSSVLLPLGNNHLVGNLQAMRFFRCIKLECHHRKSLNSWRSGQL